MGWHDELARDMAARRADFATVFAELKALRLGPRPLGEDEAELLHELADAQARMIAEWNAGDLLDRSFDAARASGPADGRAAAELERPAAPDGRRRAQSPAPIGRVPFHARMPGEPTG